jgi:hypothetical protein
MNDNYIQTVEISIKPKDRKKQIAGMTLCLLAMGFILLSAFYSLYFLIGLFLLLALGITLLQLFASCAKQYEYNYNTKRFIVSKTNNVNRKYRMLEIAREDISGFGLFKDIIEESDICVCDNPRADGVYFFKFKLKDAETRLLFTPDEYMLALITKEMGNN